MKILNSFLFVLFFSQLIYADMSDSMFFSLNTIYIDRDYKDNNVTTKYKATDNDLRLMKINLKRLAFGVIYAQSSADASDVSRSSYGLSVGYFSDKDFYISGSYFLSSKYTIGGTELKGNGYQLDVGFLSKVTSSFYAGLLVALKNFSYSEQTTNGLTSDSNNTHSELMPMFTFGVKFM